ncbi:MAG: DNA translocase FtsK, partial [Candidatus Omnitrophica bacterium]|nr:DNA translocase FtsK [Candidatus Omnitrophota bacterium]
MGKGGAHIVILTGILLSLFLAAGHYLITTFEKIFQKLKDKKILIAEFGSKSKQRSTGIKIKSTVRPDKPKVITPGPAESRTSSAVESVKSKLTDLKEKIIKPSEEDTKIKIITTEAKKTTKAASKVITQTDEDKAEYKLPGSDLLDSPPPVEQRQIEEDLQVSAQRLEDTLRDFGIECKADQVERGPVVTRYELLPAPGVKVHRITSLSDDIALAMKAHSVRIVAPIPGKAAVGVEVPNSITSMVFMKDLIESEEFYNTDYVLPIVLGKDISGESIVADLGDMPHMLIAGTTGSGKTVCVNSLITSLLFKFSPDELKFIMVDPKMVELAMYNGLPHLLCPVVTDPKKVSGALAWAVNEMEKRYKLFAKAGVRNIKVYNEQYAKDKFSPLKNVGEPDYQAYESEDREDEFGKNIPSGRLPYIVVMIDELADLMMVASAEIETAIAR